MIRFLALLSAALILAACSQEPQEDVTTVDLEGTEKPTTNPLIERYDDVKIVVDANGVGAKGVRSLKFGTARDEVDKALQSAFGKAPETSRIEECGAGPMEFSQFGPLQVGYLDGKLAGWFLGEGKGVVTSDGIRPGTTLDALSSERQVQRLDTTLEGEFQYTAADYGTITGFAAPDRTVTALAAGVTCFFR